ncbi:hypothetical protein H632_c446p1 [Helicosporidium sp. ATCC 50920]|nr:hypothetical protein H632_c446p1 [Helicosporidium sp. ATCC 50920]|eukprot:KDD75901.1 hypothetical protein H632_c446p1 [Helicosporidium sp. ATCC 50920]
MRVTLSEEEVERTGGTHRWVDRAVYRSSYNASPGAASTPVVTREADGSRTIRTMRWGLIPSFTKPDAKPDFFRMFNGRSETMAERPAFRRLLPSRRCLVLTNGFYEWRKEPKGKQPYYIHLSGDAPLVFAGLYDSWQEQGRDGPLWTFTILTTEASPSFQTLHDRMPVILPDEASRERWLDTRPESQGELQKVLGPYVQADLVWHKVTPKMGPVSFQGPECCLELQEESVKDGVKRLFSNWREQGAKEAKEGGSGKESVSGAGDERGEEGTRKKRRVKREQETEQEGGREEKGRGLEAGTAEAKAETAFELDPSPLAKPSSSELEQRTPAKQEPKQAKQTPPKRPAAKRHTPDPAQKSITQFFSP